MESVAAAVARAEADPTRPVYHFRPPALWMNDPNGTIYHNGYYHLFYQHNPYSDEWGHIHWGHARSQDLVHWEHLPIALWPSLELGEEHVFSGCAAINGAGEPLLFYTSVKSGPKASRPPNEQWAARPLDAEWITWEKHPQNPIFALATHGGPAFDREWRDPYIFTEAGRTFLVIGGDFDDTAGVGLYEATDSTLTCWAYRSLLYQKPKSETRFFECPNFIKLGEQWILLTALYQPIEYVTGSFDLQTLTFIPEQSGVLDTGFSDVPNYYATNTLIDPQGRCVLLGWVRGFAKERGWNGALALPRVLTLGTDGHPRQHPHPALQQLRGRHVQQVNQGLRNQRQRLAAVASDTFELQVRFERGDAQGVGLGVRCSEGGERGVAIRYASQTLEVAGTTVALPLAAHEPLDLHLFLDKSVLELFVNNGRAAVTRVIDPPVADLGIELFAEGGAAQVTALDLWEMGAIW